MSCATHPPTTSKPWHGPPAPTHISPGPLPSPDHPCPHRDLPLPPNPCSCPSPALPLPPALHWSWTLPWSCPPHVPAPAHCYCSSYLSCSAPCPQPTPTPRPLPTIGTGPWPSPPSCRWGSPSSGRSGQSSPGGSPCSGAHWGAGECVQGKHHGLMGQCVWEGCLWGVPMVCDKCDVNHTCQGGQRC